MARGRTSSRTFGRTETLMNALSRAGGALHHRGRRGRAISVATWGRGRVGAPRSSAGATCQRGGTPRTPGRTPRDALHPCSGCQASARAGVDRPRHRDPVAASDPSHQPLEPANTSRGHAEFSGDPQYRRNRRRDHRAANNRMGLARRHWGQSGERTDRSLPHPQAPELSASLQAAGLSALERRAPR